MSIRNSTLRRRMLAAGAILLAGTAVYAQTMKSGERILFSQSDNTASAAPTNARSLAPRSSRLINFNDAIKPSIFSFNVAPSSIPNSPPPQPTTVNPAQAAQLREAQDRQKNWAMMTPAEIMGVPTTEQVMGVPDQDAAGGLKQVSAEERYLRRQSESGQGYTNKFSTSDTEDDAHGALVEVPRDFFGRPLVGNKPSDKPIFDQSSDPSSISASAAASPWRPVNAASDVSAAPTPEQTAAAEAFQKLLQPRYSLSAKPEPALLGSPRPAVVASAVNSPIAPYTPANNSTIITPNLVRPLITSAGQKETSTTPAWKPQLPPWMYTTPQPGMVPQRKF